VNHSRNSGFTACAIDVNDQVKLLSGITQQYSFKQQKKNKNAYCGIEQQHHGAIYSRDAPDTPLQQGVIFFYPGCIKGKFW